MNNGDLLGHEFMGIVEEVGPQVTRVKKGAKCFRNDDRRNSKAY
jgi:threonine dehydrogenase-like Zn-dependent dehydrogenase